MDGTERDASLSAAPRDTILLIISYYQHFLVTQLRLTEMSGENVDSSYATLTQCSSLCKDLSLQRKI